MTLLQIPLIDTNSVSWDLYETTCTHTHAHTFKHKYTYLPWQSRQGKHLRTRERNKKGEQIHWHQINVLKSRQAFCPALRCACAHGLSPDGSRILCNHSVFPRCIWMTQRASSHTRTPTEECREYLKYWEMEGYLTLSWGSRRGESCWAGLWLRLKSVDSYETLQNLRSLEILTTPSLLPLPQQKPNAFCFECLVATSPYLIPWVYNCSLACTCPKLPRAVVTSPSCLFFSTVTNPTGCLFMWWWSLWTYSVVHFFSNEITYSYIIYFLPFKL